jgi:uncharacterized protein YciI
MYALVLLRRGPIKSTTAISKQHEEFIKDLIRRDQILLGGKWKPAAGPYEVGYILNCDSLDCARRIVAGDPYIQKGVYAADVIEWTLLGINLDSIDQSCILTKDNL